MGEHGVDVVLADGRVARIRPVRSNDLDSLRALHRRSSERSIYQRFLTLNLATADSYAERICAAEEGSHALAALLDDGVVGVASRHDSKRAGEAEVAVFVDDRYRHLGIATLLLEHLAAEARTAGVRRFRAAVLAANAPMLQVLTHSGFRCEKQVADGVVTVTVATDPDESALQAMEERERLAEVTSLTPLLQPRAVAVIGASRQPGTVGHELLATMQRAGFTGRLYAVNRAGGPVLGVPAYPQLADVPEPVDLAVVAVPASGVAEVIEECAGRGVRAAVVLSSGFAELSEQGASVQRELVRVARRHGLRIVGPNCLGVVNTDSSVRLDATFVRGTPLPGRVAFLSQSGALGIAVLDHSARLGLGLSTFVSVGNKADVSGNDLLLYWEQDPRTDVIALYLESFGNPRKFARIARRVSASKPVIAVKGGRSGGGRRAASSHTAAAMSSEQAVDALFRQAGVTRVNSLEELLDTARVLAHQPLPAGGRLGIVGNAGGAGVLAADAAAAAGLEVPPLAATLPLGTARGAVPEPQGIVGAGQGAVQNPADLGAGAGPDAFFRAIHTLLGSGQLDSLLVIFAATLVGDTGAVLRAIARAAAGHAEIPVVTGVLGAEERPVLLPTPAPGTHPVPCYEYPETAARALGHATRYARWRRRPTGRPIQPSGIASRDARDLVDAYLVEWPDGGWLDFARASAILGSYGVPITASLAAESPDAAVQAARRIGFPVALKADVPGMVHKSERGGVQLDLSDDAAVHDAYHAMRGTIGPAMRRGIVQRMAGSGIEMIVGVNHDRSFGPVLMVGMGGVHTDLLADRAFRLLPLTDVDAGEMVRSLRHSPILFGYRGAPGADVAALEDLLGRVAALAMEVPQVAELDLNPVRATLDGVTVLDVKLRLKAMPDESEPWLRRLR